MQISGSNHLAADPATAWAAFHDQSVLVATLPGAQAMREVAPGSFEMTVSAGVAAIRGTYDGTAVFSQEVPEESFVLSLAGSGGPGTINADVKVDMSPAADEGTDLTWVADATVGGPVGGVGQRMLSGVAKRLAGQFFANIDKELQRRASGEPEPGPAAAAASTGSPTDARATVTARDSAPTSTAAAGPVGGLRAAALPGSSAGDDSFVKGMAIGAAVALLGVVVGARARGRGR